MCVHRGVQIGALDSHHVCAANDDDCCCCCCLIDVNSWRLESILPYIFNVCSAWVFLIWHSTASNAKLLSRAKNSAHIQAFLCVLTAFPPLEVLGDANCVGCICVARYVNETCRRHPSGRVFKYLRKRAARPACKAIRLRRRAASSARHAFDGDNVRLHA